MLHEKEGKKESSFHEIEIMTEMAGLNQQKMNESYKLCRLGRGERVSPKDDLLHFVFFKRPMQIFLS